jgi:predicted dinucleotide-binding enzyme
VLLGEVERAVLHHEVVVRALAATLGRHSIDTLQARWAYCEALVLAGDDGHAERELAGLINDAEAVLEPWHPLMLEILDCQT